MGVYIKPLRIKEGALIGHDMGGHVWPLEGFDVDLVFETGYLMPNDRLCVRAPGLGGQPYGGGAVFVKASDTTAMEEPQ